MTTTVLEFKCPTCGHLIGEEEYEMAIKKMSKVIEETSNVQIEKFSECDIQAQRLGIYLILQGFALNNHTSKHFFGGSQRNSKR